MVAIITHQTNKYDYENEIKNQDKTSPEEKQAYHIPLAVYLIKSQRFPIHRKIRVGVCNAFCFKHFYPAENADDNCFDPVQIKKSEKRKVVIDYADKRENITQHQEWQYRHWSLSWVEYRHTLFFQLS